MTKQLIDIEIPGEPVAKGRPRMGKYGVYTPTKTKNAEEAIGWRNESIVKRND